MKRVLIVGASSFIGSNLAIALRDKYRVVGTWGDYRPRIDGIVTLPLFISPGAALEQFTNIIRPDVVIYCVGVRSEEKCLEDPLGAIFVNAEAAANIARAIQRWSGRMIFFSTPKIFPGDLGNYSETDAPKPNSQYGISKANAESFLADYENTFILRISSAYGFASRDCDAVLNQILFALWDNHNVTVVTDELRSFISIDDISRAVEIAIESETSLAGTYHFGSPTPESYYEFALKAADAFGYPQSRINGVIGKKFSAQGFHPENRWRDLTMDSTKWAETFGFTPMESGEGLKRLSVKFRKGNL